MPFIETYERELKNFLYGDKASKLDISKYFFEGRTPDYGINICKLIRGSISKDEFRRKVILDLKKDDNTDYLHFSLIMGLYFGVFNLYNYLYIKPDVRKKIIDSNPNRHDTMNFILNNYSSFYSYFNKKYGIDDSTLRGIISRMFFVVYDEDDYSFLYNNFITKEIGIILMGASLSGLFASCESAIDYFYLKNDNDKFKLY